VLKHGQLPSIYYIDRYCTMLIRNINIIAFNELTFSETEYKTGNSQMLNKIIRFIDILSCVFKNCSILKYQKFKLRTHVSPNINVHCKHT